MKASQFVSFVATSVVALASLSAAPAEAEPFRLDRALSAPAPLDVSFEHRFRYERLNGQFRPLPQSTDDIVVLRTLVHARLRLSDDWTVGAELQDSRALAEENAGVLNTTVVNAAELLRAYLEFDRDDVAGGNLSLRGGRITMDVGSRRLVARNRYRNTINGFTGIDAEWRRDDGYALRAFWTLPVQRLPSDGASLRDNEVDFDREDTDVQFWGLVGEAPLAGSVRGELMIFGLHERDSARRPTANRQLYTPSLRILRPAAVGRADFVVETAVQFGESRAGTAGTEDLDHLAHHHHAEAGYTFDAAWRPRVALQYDFASGDDDPNDGDNNRFTTLFGARRFEWGPTGIYGPFARANLSTPGIRVAVRPSQRLRGFAAFRSYWLADKRDAWTTTGLRDPSGGTDSYVGSQIEFRVRYQLLPGNVDVEAGYAHLFDGDFMRDAPASPNRGDAAYGYTQMVLRY